MARRTFAGLDGLRAVAIIAVVWHHTAAPAFTPTLSGRGFLGVDLFFVISGFLIVTLLLRERQRTGTIALRHFYIRRALRIFPLYYAFLGALALFAVTVGRHGSQAALLLEDLPVAAVYLSNWFAVHGLLEMTWSLAAEEQFYLLWPFIERFWQRAALPMVGIALVGSWAISLWSSGEGPLPSMLRETTFAPILLGVLLAHVLHRRRGFDAAMTIVGWRMMPVVLPVLILACASISSFGGWPRAMTQLLMMMWLASVVVREDHVLMALLRNRALVRIGTLSYGIYILHLLCRHIVHAVLLRFTGMADPLLLFAVTLVMSVGVAQISYVVFERRFLAWKARFG